MQRDLEAFELVCKHYDACYSSDALRKEKNRVRTLFRRLLKLETENAVLKNGNRRWLASSGGRAMLTSVYMCGPLMLHCGHSIGFSAFIHAASTSLAQEILTLTYECQKLE